MQHGTGKCSGESRAAYFTATDVPTDGLPAGGAATVEGSLLLARRNQILKQDYKQPQTKETSKPASMFPKKMLGQALARNVLRSLESKLKNPLRRNEHAEQSSILEGMCQDSCWLILW